MQYHKQYKDQNNSISEEKNANSHNDLNPSKEFKEENLDNCNTINNEQVLQKKVNEYKDKYLRSLAELENLKKHSSKLLEDANYYAISKFAKELLNVMDVFNKALDTLDISKISDSSFKSFVDGITLTQQELSKIFKKFNISILDNSIIGQQFDPNYQEALLTKEDKNQDNETIFEVYEAGYLLKDKLLRPAKVGIIKNS